MNAEPKCRAEAPIYYAFDTWKHTKTKTTCLLDKCERRKGEQRGVGTLEESCSCDDDSFDSHCRWHALRERSATDRRAKPQEPSADAELARRVEEIRQYWKEAEKYRVRPQDISQGEHPNLHVDQLRDLLSAIDADPADRHADRRCGTCAGLVLEFEDYGDNPHKSPVMRWFHLDRLKDSTDLADPPGAVVGTPKCTRKLPEHTDPPCPDCGRYLNQPTESGRWRVRSIHADGTERIGLGHGFSEKHGDRRYYQHEHQDQWVDCPGKAREPSADAELVDRTRYYATVAEGLAAQAGYADIGKGLRQAFEKAAARIEALSHPAPADKRVEEIRAAQEGPTTETGTWIRAGFDTQAAETLAEYAQMVRDLLTALAAMKEGK